MFNDFYSAFAEASLALLGLWWVVVELKATEWMTQQDHRRIARFISLYFLFPGIMAVASLLAEDSASIWRTVFGVVAFSGAATTLSATRIPVEKLGMGKGGYVYLLLTGIAYLLVVLIAIAPRTAEAISDLQPLVIEGLLLSLLLLLGVNLGWQVFAHGPGRT